MAMAWNRRRVARTAVLAAIALALAAALAFALRPRRVEVETAAAARGPIRVTVDGTGKTRVRDLYVVASPIAGDLERLARREGDRVRAGDVVARFAPATPAPLDARTRAELSARLEAARAAEAEARAGAERARVEAAQAERDLARSRDLAAGGSVSPSDVEAAESSRRAKVEQARMAQSAVARAAGDVEAARAAAAAHRLPSAGRRGADALELRSPISGRVLRVHRESEGPIAAGAPIMEIGDPAALEAEIELLTTQAVRVRSGAPVEIVRWGGEAPLRGTVRRVDPAGFTKVSALGVEEQRVHVVVGPDGPGWERLGDGYAVEARIVVSEKADALKVPGSALFRVGQRWSAFVVEGGRARLRPIEVADSSGIEVSIASGLVEGERVVLHPSDEVADGVRVTASR
jgi:HlyD family secretion protein